MISVVMASLLIVPRKALPVDDTVSEMSLSFPNRASIDASSTSVASTLSVSHRYLAHLHAALASNSALEKRPVDIAAYSREMTLKFPEFTANAAFKKFFSCLRFEGPRFVSMLHRPASRPIMLTVP